MPIYDRGYRRWSGALHGRFHRWFVIAKTGIRLSMRGKWLRRFVLIAWLPLLYYGLVFFAVGQMTEVENVEKVREMWQFQVLQDMFGGRLTERFIEDPSLFRPLVWSLLIHFFLRYTQIFCVMIVVAIVGPKLVAEDLKTRALTLYFSKPLTRIDYMAGKLAVVSFWVFMVTLLPALALYALSILFSPSLATLAQTATLIPKIVAYAVLLTAVCGSIMLALSSCTPNPRFLGFIWAGFWVMSIIASSILSTVLFPPGSPSRGDNWTGLVSFSGNFDAVGYRLFNIENLLEPVAVLSPRAERLREELSYGHDWRWSLLILLVLTAISLLVLFRRIRRPGEVQA